MSERTEANFWPYNSRGIYMILAATMISVIVGSILALAHVDMGSGLVTIFFGSLIGCWIALRDGYKGPLDM